MTDTPRTNDLKEKIARDICITNGYEPDELHEGIHNWIYYDEITKLIIGNVADWMDESDYKLQSQYSLAKKLRKMK